MQGVGRESTLWNNLPADLSQMFLIVAEDILNYLDSFTTQQCEPSFNCAAEILHSFIHSFIL